MLAERRDAPPARPRPRVATKYVETTRRFFAGKGMQAEIIRLYGSMEIAPAVGLADCIVDLVDTGATLAANGLVVREEIAAISARLIVNKAAMKLSREGLGPRRAHRAPSSSVIGRARAAASRPSACGDAPDA